ncbi:FtsX-like permease family protein [Dactylosporangium sp. NPDC051541]|uniref:FtsX-like permease family protein n=1 Tax=Dactylosporangium sp. NPDC051541 TaxID=3363977 RepID=UPI00378AAEB8
MSLSMIRYRWSLFLGTFVALLLGVAVLSGCLSVWAAAQPRVPDALADAPVIVAAPRFDPPDGGFATYRPWSAAELDRLTTELAAVPGVAAVVPDRPFYVQRLVDGQPVGDRREALHSGRSWSAPQRPVSGAAPANPGEVVVDRALGLPVGAAMDVVTAAGPATWTVTGTIDRPGFYVSEATAAALAPGARFIALRLAPGADAGAVAGRLPAVLGGLGTALAGDARGAAESEEDLRTRWIGAQLIIAVVFVGFFVAVFVVASTCAFSASQRRQELGLLRAVGATPGQVRRMLLAEALLVGLAAGVPGALLGAALAPLLAGPFVATGLEPTGFEVGFTWWAPMCAVAVGLVVAAAGVWLSARRAARVPALEALRVAAAEPRPMTLARWLTGGGAVLLGGGLALLLPGSTAEQKPTIVLGSAMVLLVGAALLAPVFVVPLVRLVTWPARRGATGLLVREGARVSARRVGSTAAPVLAAVGFAVLLVGTFQTADEAVGIEDTAKIPESAVATRADNAPGLSEAAVRAQGGRSELASTVYLESGEPLDAVGTAAADVVAPAGRGWKVGQPVPLRFADGAVLPVTVTALAAQDGFSLPRDLVRVHDPAALTQVVYLQHGFVPAPGAVALTARSYVEREAAEEGDLIDLFLAILLGISVGFTGLAVANTLLMATNARRPEFVTLHRAGATTGQAVRVVVSEALLSVLMGSLLGLAVAVPALFEARAGLQDEIGAAVTLVMPWGTLVVVVSVCGVLAALASSLPLLRRRAGGPSARTMAG